MNAGKKNWKVTYKDWKVTRITFIRSKHFTNDDFVKELLDKTKARVRKRTSLKHRYLKKDAFPSIFPNCPIYLSKKIPVRQSVCSTAKQREDVFKERVESKEKQD